MNFLRQYRELVAIQIRMSRADTVMIAVVNVAMTLGLVLGIGYIVPDISKVTATFITTGTATQTLVNVGLVMLPQVLSNSKEVGRLDFFLTLPISREAYLLSQVTAVGIFALPGVAFAVAFGWWNYDLSLHVDPLVVLVAILAVLSLAGAGVDGGHLAASPGDQRVLSADHLLRAVLRAGAGAERTAPLAPPEDGADHAADVRRRRRSGHAHGPPRDAPLSVAAGDVGVRGGIARAERGDDSPAGLTECRSSGVSGFRNYSDTPLRRHSDTPVMEFTAN